MVDLGAAWRLSGPWYRDRLDHGWRPKTAARMRELFEGAGLTGEFWTVT